MAAFDVRYLPSRGSCFLNFGSVEAWRFPAIQTCGPHRDVSAICNMAGNKCQIDISGDEPPIQSSQHDHDLASDGA